MCEYHVRQKAEIGNALSIGTLSADEALSELRALVVEVAKCENCK